MFHEMVCFTCNGGGVVLNETGEALTSDELVVELRIRLTERGNYIRKLKKFIEGLFPYMEKKKAADLKEAMYPSDITEKRAASGLGGFGD